MAKLVKRIKINKINAVFITLLAIGLFILAALFISWLANVLNLSRPTSTTAYVSLFLLTGLLGITLHELIHGITYMFMGFKAGYGVKLAAGFLPIAYAHAKGAKMSVGQAITAGLSPFIVISLLCIILLGNTAIYPYVVMLFVTNVSGSAGDLWFTGVLLMRGSNGKTLIVDTKDGFDIYKK